MARALRRERIYRTDLAYRFGGGGLSVELAKVLAKKWAR